MYVCIVFTSSTLVCWYPTHVCVCHVHVCVCVMYTSSRESLWRCVSGICVVRTVCVCVKERVCVCVTFVCVCHVHMISRRRTLQHTATHCNNTATHCALQCVAGKRCVLQ